MALNSNAYKQYIENSVYTASPEELTLMLYNALIKFLMQARSAIEQRNIEDANKYLIKSQDIIDEFACTLDFNYEISANLLSLYDYMSWSLAQENVKKDNKNLDDVLKVARELRDTWAEAMKCAKQQNCRPAQNVADR